MKMTKILGLIGLTVTVAACNTTGTTTVSDFGEECRTVDRVCAERQLVNEVRVEKSRSNRAERVFNYSLRK